MSTSTLQQAIAAATSDSTTHLRLLEDQIHDLFDRLADIGELPEVSDARKALQLKLDGYRSVMAHFNIVIFGRTGAGKSSLIETLTRGDGRSISTGESDFTTSVQSVQWGPCRLYDTPGVSGWGRTLSGEELEAEARSAIQIADVVLLAFDSQSQQTDEFEKIAKWVIHFDKPVIAVLNVRNARWRRPDKVPTLEQRRGLSQPVREHIAHIRDGLADEGLRSVPIVAWHARSGVAGRCTEYTGPDARAIQSMQAASSAEVLIARSNVRRLEWLIEVALEDDARGIRLQSASNDIRTSLEDLRLAVAEADELARLSASPLERLVGEVITLVGLGAADGTGAWDRALLSDTQGRDRLELLEGRSGLTFGRARLRGQLEERLDAMLDTGLLDLQQQWFETLDEVVFDAFDEGRAVDESDLIAKTQPHLAAAEDLVSRCASELRDHADASLTRSGRRAARAEADIEATYKGFDGGVGHRRTFAGLGLEIVGVLAVAALALSPPGLAVGVVTAGAAFVAGFIGRRLRGGAEREKLEDRADAIVAVRETTAKVFHGFRQHAHDDLRTVATDVVCEVLIPTLDRLIDIHRSSDLRDEADRQMGALIDDLVQPSVAMEVVCRAQRRVQEREHPGDRRAPRLLWAGEDWLVDDAGLCPPDPDLRAAPGRRPQLAQANFDSAAARIRAAVPPDLEQLYARWRANFDLLPEDDQLNELLDTAETGAVRAPHVGVVGSPGSGTSTLAHALTMRSAERTEDGADHQSSRIRYLDVGADLRGDICADLLDATAGCSVILLLIPPTVGAPTVHLIELLAMADRPLGWVNQRLVIPCLGRIDEIGVDPWEEPELFTAGVDRKAQEVADVFTTRGIGHDADGVVAVCAAPYGYSRTDGDPTLRPLGVDQLHQAIVRGLGSLPWQQLQTTRILLLEIEREVGTRRITLDRLRTEQGSHRWDLQLTREAAERLAAGILAPAEQRLRRDVGDIVDRMTVDVLRVKDPAKLKERKDKLTDWPQDDRIAQVLSTWECRLREDVENWQAAFERAARLGESAGRLSGGQQVGDLGSSRPRASEALRTAGDALGYAGRSRDAWYNLAKSTLNWKFKPWGAIKGAERARVFGQALGRVAAALAAIELTYDVVRSRQQERTRALLLKDSRDSVRTVLDEYLRGPEGDHEEGAGPLFSLEAVVDGLNEESKTIEAELADLERRVALASESVASAQALAIEGLEMLL